MSQKLKALEILKHYTGSVAPITFTPKVISEAIEEFEQYEQNFKKEEFKYRTECQNTLSIGRIEADAMPDKLAELEKVILDYYLAKGYEIGVGNWNFRVEIISRWKSKYIAIRFYENNQETLKYIQTSNTTKEMFDEAIECFETKSRNDEIYKRLLEYEKFGDSILVSKEDAIKMLSEESTADAT